MLVVRKLVLVVVLLVKIAFDLVLTVLLVSLLLMAM